MISCFIPAALKRLDISAILLSKKDRLKILRQASFLSKIMYVNNEGSNHWMAAWFDGNTRAEAKTIFEYRELIDQFASNCGEADSRQGGQRKFSMLYRR